MKPGLIQKIEHIVWFKPELVSEYFFGIFSFEYSHPGFLEKLFGFPGVIPSRLIRISSIVMLPVDWWKGRDRKGIHTL